MKKLLRLIIIVSLAYLGLSNVYSNETDTSIDSTDSIASTDISKAIFAGGCFWCIEADFEKLDGVTEAVSGYTGGKASTATYKQVGHVESEHFEAIEVTYDPTIVSYAELVEYFWIHIDPTDPVGQFCDKGSAYRSAIFYSNEEEKLVVEKSLTALNNSKPFTDPIVTTVTTAKPFYKAEKYHQNYYRKNPIRYNYYRNGCRRDKRIADLWGKHSQ